MYLPTEHVIEVLCVVILFYENEVPPHASCFLSISTSDRMGYLTGAGSDYAAFVHYLGIASMDISYTYDRV